MGCFLACFGPSKEQKRRNQRKNNKRHGSHDSRPHTVSSEQATSAETLNPNSDVPEKVEEQLSLITRKKVTFDTNVKTYEPVSVHESTETLPETDKNAENRSDGSEKPSLLEHTLLADDSLTSSVGSYPPKHRYQNCQDSDDETEEIVCEDSDLDDEGDDIEDYSECEEDDSEILSEKVWAESIPTASMESRTEISSVLAATVEVNSPLITKISDENEGKMMGFNQNARDRSLYVHPVLNPVENITQWKAVKSRASPQLKPQKENFTANQTESHLSFSFMCKPDQSTNHNQEISVDASLSNWLVSSRSTPIEKTSTLERENLACEAEKSYSLGSNSVTSIEDRPILGALTVEEITQFSASKSPRRSPSKSPEEMPIIGSVGRYWSSSESAKDSSLASYKGIPNTTSKYREDKRVIWHSTPFETRLERALNRGC